jgi:hypothetical protein
MGRMEKRREEKRSKFLLYTAIIGLLKVIVEMLVAIIERKPR